jgi:hypothetical protein
LVEHGVHRAEVVHELLVPAEVVVREAEQLAVRRDEHVLENDSVQRRHVLLEHREDSANCQLVEAHLGAHGLEGVRAFLRLRRRRRLPPGGGGRRPSGKPPLELLEAQSVVLVHVLALKNLHRRDGSQLVGRQLRPAVVRRVRRE